MANGWRQFVLWVLVAIGNLGIFSPEVSIKYGFCPQSDSNAAVPKSPDSIFRDGE